MQHCRRESPPAEKEVDPGTKSWYHQSMNSRLKKTYKEIYKDPVKSDIAWSDIEALFAALGAEIKTGSGSRVRMELNGERAVFHRPHPKGNTDKGAVKSVRRFLENAGVKL